MQNRGQLDTVTENEFENLTTQFTGLWNVEHNGDGTHNMNADGVTSGVFDPARIPDLNASIITTGTLSPSVLPTLATVPTGSMVMWPVASPPTGWLLCNGQAVSRTTDSALFALIGTTYGAGNGTTTFNVPNFQQRFPLGVAASGTGSTLAGTGGAIDHTHVYTSVVQHTHSVTDPGHIHTITDPGHSHTIAVQSSLTGSLVGPGASGTAATPSTSTNTTGITIVSNTTGITIQNTGTASPSTQSANPPFLAINFIIKT